MQERTLKQTFPASFELMSELCHLDKYQTRYGNYTGLGIRECLYRLYSEELRKYRTVSSDEFPDTRDFDSFRAWYKNFLCSDSLLRWHAIRKSNLEGCEVGFLIVQPRLKESGVLVDADNYIVEAFVAPEYRRKGYMSRALAKACRRYPGAWCLHVYKKNHSAQNAWKQMFSELGYVAYEIDDPYKNSVEAEDFYFLGFKPERGRYVD